MPKNMPSPAQGQSGVGVPAISTRATSAQAALFALLCAGCAEFFLHVLAAPAPRHTESFSAIGRVLVLFLTLFILHRFSSASFRFYRPNLKDLACIALILVGAILTTWLGRIVAVSMSTYLSTPRTLLPVETFSFAIPYASGGLLVQAVLGLHYGIVYAVSLALVVSMYVPGSALLTCYVLATSLVACLSLSRFRSRSAYLRAGLNIALVSLPIALCSTLIEGQYFSLASWLTILSSLLGGMLCSFLASGVTPIVEYVGGYATDMRLLEMATLDHALLKELSVQAPGTWNHSMVMGMMVEASADGIGASPILCRVGAYFHDIGKVKKPLYFVENQTPGENRHDKLSTSMSALIIRSHVKDGIELARKYGLPKIIEDMIPQHHGTSRIEFFYDKACKEAEEAGEDPTTVDESLYRYPGPKPQTREAGILMLADGIEAAARTLTDPSYDRIQGMVQKMMNKVFASGELNECDLTLKDLHVIAKSFTRILSGIYHQRIAYAEPVEKSKAEGSEVLTEEAPLISVLENPADDKVGRESPEENLKRLGL